jgi:hypothetical protein
MMTRSNTKRQLQLTNNEKTPNKNILEVDIDFDEAIKEWRSNKKSVGNGQYKYLCQLIDTKCIKGTQNSVCERVCYKGTNKCWKHRSK